MTTKRAQRFKTTLFLEALEDRSLMSYTPIDLGVLGGAGGMTPYAVNSANQVVGVSSAPSGDAHAFLWDNGAITDLGTLGGAASAASDINDAGQIVGQSDTATTGEKHAFLWQSGSMTDLGVAVLEGWSPVINSQGSIVGNRWTASQSGETALLRRIDDTAGGGNARHVAAQSRLHLVIRAGLAAPGNRGSIVPEGRAFGAASLVPSHRLTEAKRRRGAEPMQERDIFIEVLQTDPAERWAHLDAACGSDVELRRRVVQLLARGQKAVRLARRQERTCVQKSRGNPVSPIEAAW